MIQYRLGQKKLHDALAENLKCAALMAVFFGGLSFHLNVAIRLRRFQIDKSWGTTAKEKEDSNFFKEIPKIMNSLTGPDGYLPP